jgi:hypothetical protein
MYNTLGKCFILTLTDYINTHDNVAKIIHKQKLQPLLYYKYQKRAVTENNNLSYRGI